MLLLAPRWSQVQEESRIGIKGGINLSNLYTPEIDSRDAPVGFNIGLFTEIAVSEVFGIQPEVLYFTKGNQITYGTEGD